MVILHGNIRFLSLCDPWNRHSNRCPARSCQLCHAPTGGSCAMTVMGWNSGKRRNSVSRVDWRGSRVPRSSMHVLNYNSSRVTVACHAARQRKPGSNPVWYICSLFWITLIICFAQFCSVRYHLFTWLSGIYAGQSIRSCRIVVVSWHHRQRDGSNESEGLDIHRKSHKFGEAH